MAAALIAVAAPATAWASGGTGQKAGAGEVGLNFLPLPTVAISVIRQARVRGLLNVSVELELPDLAGRKRAKKLSPRLSNEYYRVLTHYVETRVEIGKTVNLRHVELLLQRATDKVLGKNKATVLIIDAAIQKR